MTVPKATIVLAAAIAVAGCQTRPTQLPRGQDAYAVAPPADPLTPAAPRRLVAGDQVAITVYREPDLSLARARIDESGIIQMPLLGEVQASGMTLGELSQSITARLGARFLRRPQVSISLVEVAAQTVTVEGQVNQPGVYPVGATDTLLTALARARSPTDVARIDEVVIFRTVDGQRAGGVFNLAAIRAGQAPDPQIRDGDTVVVGFSAVKGAFRDFLKVTPLFNLFTIF